MKCLVWNFSVDRVRKSAAQNLRFCGFWNPRGRGRCLAHDFITKQELWIPCFEEVNHTRKDHGKSNAMDSTCYSSAGSKCVLKEKQHGCNLLNLWLHSKILLSPLLLLVLCCEHFIGLQRTVDIYSDDVLAFHDFYASVIKLLTHPLFHEFSSFLVIETIFPSIAKRCRCFEYIEEMIHKQEPLLKVLRLLVLFSVTNSGLTKKHFDHFR